MCPFVQFSLTRVTKFRSGQSVERSAGRWRCCTQTDAVKAQVNLIDVTFLYEPLEVDTKQIGRIFFLKPLALLRMQNAVNGHVAASPFSLLRALI